MILPHEQDITEKYFFFSWGSTGADENVTASFACKNTHATYSHEHYKMTITTF